VILLNEDCIEEPDPVIVAATTGNCILLLQTQTGKGLTGIEKTHPRPLDSIGITARQRGGTGKGLQIVERGSFAAEQCAGVSLHPAKHSSRGDPIAVSGRPGDQDTGIQLPEHPFEPGGPAQHSLLPTDHLDR